MANNILLLTNNSDQNILNQNFMNLFNNIILNNNNNNSFNILI